MGVTIDFSPKHNAGWPLSKGLSKYNYQVVARKEGTNTNVSRYKYFKTHSAAVSYARSLAKKKKANEIFNHYTHKLVSLKASKKSKSKRSSGGRSYNSIDRILWG